MSEVSTPHTTPLTNLTGGIVSQRPLEGKLAIITGASRGIGAAIARNLASKGANVVLNYTSNSSTTQTTRLAQELSETYSIHCLPIQADLSNPTLACPHIITLAKSHFSHPKTQKFQIDILINNAGVAGNQSIAGSTSENFTRLYTINVLAPLLLVQAALPYLPTDRSGRIVNLSSISSSLGLKGQSIYGGTKAALEAMTRTWARELSERCTVNAVNPGPVATDMYAGTSEEFKEEMEPHIRAAPLMRARPGVDLEEVVQQAEKEGGREGWDWEVAGVVGMLCSTESGWCTGSVVCANGGLRFSI